MRIKLKIKIHVIILALIFSFAYISLVPKISFLRVAYLKTVDLFIYNRYLHSKVSDIAKKIIIVNIDEETLKKLKTQWPINRGFTAYFLEKMSQPKSRPEAIGIDLVFSGRGDSKEADLWLASALKNASNVTIASFFDPKGNLSLPDGLFIDAVKSVGFINSPRDIDLTIRDNYPFVFLKNNELSFSFALKIFATINRIDLKKAIYSNTTRTLKLVSSKDENIHIPVDPKTYFTKINYLVKAENFKTLPFWQVIAGLESPETFKDKIVLVNTNMEIAHDVHSTPLGLMSGICINANFLLNIILNRFLTELPVKVNFVMLFILALLIGTVTARMGGIKGFILLLIILAGGYYATAKYLLKDIIVDFFGIVSVTVLSYLIISAIEYTYILLENIKLRKLAVTDGLTGLFVFRYFEVKLNRELNIALETKKDVSLVIFDIDHFKTFNDTYGHDAGNEIIKNIATILKTRCRHDDTVCRFGGEEFVAILPHTNLDGASKYAEAIRKNIEMFSFNWESKDLKATISAGAASLFNLQKTTSQELIRAADKALYAAKESGRNKVSSMNKKE